MSTLALPLALAQEAKPAPDDQYVPGPDSKEQPAVPKGTVTKFTWDRSKIFPDTVRDYWVYVPAQYQPGKAAAVFVCQDGLSYQAPTVFDNLIHKKEMPVTIGIFTNIRGGNVYPSLILKTAKKPIRVFLQDGANDLVNPFGSWPEANKARWPILSF